MYSGLINLLIELCMDLKGGIQVNQFRTRAHHFDQSGIDGVQLIDESIVVDYSVRNFILGQVKLVQLLVTYNENLSIYSGLINK